MIKKFLLLVIIGVSVMQIVSCSAIQKNASSTTQQKGSYNPATAKQ